MSGNIDFTKKVFDIKNEPMPKGSWWWWFWLFFFDNPKNPEKPRQLMILWSTKNEKVIDCNDLKITFNRSLGRRNLDGALASWYFDGEKMHHNFLLEQCNIKVTGKELSTDSKTPTSFAIAGKKSTVKIGKDFEFIAEMIKKHDFTRPEYHSNDIIGNKGYRILRVNHFDLKGKVEGKEIEGSAYFQRVFVNAPSPSWYWGLFHFDKGAILSYFRPHFMGLPIKQDITLFDGKNTHRFKNIRVNRKGTDVPDFEVSGENENEKISFTVNAYSHSSWTFRKLAFGFLPSRLVYNEYPATISDMTLLNKVSGKELRLGKAIGNAEHTTGLLL